MEGWVDESVDELDVSLEWFMYVWWIDRLVKQKVGG